MVCLPTRLCCVGQGVDINTSLTTSSQVNNSSGIFRFGFVGRWDPVKGLHVLVDAFKRLPKDIPAELYILATAAGTEAEKYGEQVRRSAADDQRIRFLPG